MVSGSDCLNVVHDGDSTEVSGMITVAITSDRQAQARAPMSVTFQSGMVTSECLSNVSSGVARLAVTHSVTVGW